MSTLCPGCAETISFPFIFECCGNSYCGQCALDLTGVALDEIPLRDAYAHMIASLTFIRVFDEDKNSIGFRNERPAYRTCNNYIGKKSCPFCQRQAYRLYPNVPVHHLVTNQAGTAETEACRDGSEKSGWARWS